MTPVVEKRLADSTAEEVRRSHAQAIAELQQQLAAATPLVVRNVVLPDTVGITVAHRLGRKPTFVGVSAVRGAATAGVVQDFGSRDVAGNVVDTQQVVSLRAIGYGADITVDLLFL